MGDGNRKGRNRVDFLESNYWEATDGEGVSGVSKREEERER